MNLEFGIGNLNFQTFYVSKDIVNNPLIPQFEKLVAKLKKNKILDKIEGGLISFSYGKRVLINCNKTKIDEIRDEDFIDVVDFDPIKNNILVIGKKQPCFETPVHWMIHHARNDVNIVVQLFDENLSNKISKKYPLVENDYPLNNIEMIKEILKELRDSKIVILKNGSVLFCAQSPDDVENMVLDAYEVKL
jgi:hypothetical protein